MSDIDDLIRRLQEDGGDLSLEAAAQIKRLREYWRRATRERDDFASNPIFED